MRCPNCGGLNEDAATECGGCHIKLGVPTPAPTTVANPPRITRSKLYYDEMMRSEPPRAPSPAPAPAEPAAAEPAPAPDPAPEAPIPPPVAVSKVAPPPRAYPVSTWDMAPAPRKSPGLAAPVALTFPITFLLGAGIGSQFPSATPPPPPPAPVALALDPSLPGGSVKTGEVYRFHLADGSIAEHTIVGVKDGKIGTVRASVKIVGESATRDDDKPYRVPMTPTAGTPESGKETLTVSGRRFECTVYEVKAPAGDKRRYWFSRRYPYLLKQTSDATTLIELVEIASGERAP